MNPWFLDTTQRGQLTYVNQCFGTMWGIVKNFWDIKKAGHFNEVELAKARQLLHKTEKEMLQLKKVTEQTFLRQRNKKE